MSNASLSRWLAKAHLTHALEVIESLDDDEDTMVDAYRKHTEKMLGEVQQKLVEEYHAKGQEVPDKMPLEENEDEDESDEEDHDEEDHDEEDLPTEGALEATNSPKQLSLGAAESDNLPGEAMEGLECAGELRLW